MKYRYALSCSLLLSGCLWNNETLSIDVLKIRPPTQASSEMKLNEPSVAPQARFEQQGPREFYIWAAEAGYPQAEEMMGLLYLYAEPHDRVLGEEYLLRAYHKQSITAGIELARLYSEGSLYDPQYDKAMTYLTPGLNAKNLQAIKLAYVIESLNHNKAKSMMYLEQAAELDDPESKEQLAQYIVLQKNGSWQRAQQLSAEAQQEGLYEEINDLKDFWPHSAPLIKSQNSSTMLQDNHQSLLNLPHLPKFFPKAFYENFRKAASQGSPYAAYQEALQRLTSPVETKIITQKDGDLLSLLNQAQQTIIPAKVLKARLIMRHYWPQFTFSDAIVLLQEAAQENDPYALFALSALSRQKGDYDESVKFYKKATSLENHAEGQFEVANDLIQGNFTFWDHSLAYDWVTELAQLDYNPALLLLADLKDEKKIASKTQEEIFLHRLRAAWQGSLRGQYLVGNMYLKGQAVPSNTVKAFRWFNAAARAGYRPAQLQVGLMYEQGTGVNKSLPKAFAWQKISSEALYEGSHEALHLLVLSMPQSELQEAIRLEKLFKENYT